MIDTHIHLDAESYDAPDQVIARARSAGVRGVVVPGVSPSSNARVLALAAAYPGFVHPAFGFHPESYDLSESDLEQALAQIHDNRDRIHAVGEVGLPWYGDRAAAATPAARDHLATLARAAANHDLAIILHAPHGAAGPALEIVRSAGVKRAVFHWHKSERRVTSAILDAGYMISLTPEAVYRDRDQDLVRAVPLSNLLVETDGPAPHRGPFTGCLTEPWMIARTFEAIALIVGDTPQAVRAATTANAIATFRFHPAPLRMIPSPAAVLPSICGALNLYPTARVMERRRGV
jgi:TatD DNase family protein